MFVSDSAKEAPDITDHLSPNLNTNMNLLFYNFNNSRANTASGGKRAPSMGLEMERDTAMDSAVDQYKSNQIPLDKLMYSTDAF